MKSTRVTGALMFFAVTVLAGCASNGPPKTSNAPSSYSHADTSRYGAIESIQAICSTNATTGAVIGNTLEENRSAQAELYEIRVRLDSGDIAAVMQASIYEMHPGNRVRVADGRVYRY